MLQNIANLDPPETPGEAAESGHASSVVMAGFCGLWTKQEAVLGSRAAAAPQSVQRL